MTNHMLENQQVSSYEKVYDGKVRKDWYRSFVGCSVSGIGDL